MIRRTLAVAITAALIVAGCGDDDEEGEGAADNDAAAADEQSDEAATDAPPPDDPAAAPAIGILSVDSTWQWQIQGEVDTDVDVDVYDIDLVDPPDEVFTQLRSDGRIIVCYFSAGSYEEWRGDAGDFADADLGKALDEWEGERWLDHRSDGVRDIMSARLDRAVERGCSGVEPDNVTAYNNDTGFDLTADDQLDYNRFLATEAHDRGLLIGLKNDLEQIPALVDDFDFAVNEQCHEYDECDVNQPFIEAGKPVFNAEYADQFVNDPDTLCAAALTEQLRTLVLPLDLDGSFRISCD